MDRCALFVDAGYLLADGAMAVHGTRNRGSVSWDYAGLVQFLNEVARDRTGLPLLRCYWYEAVADERRSQEQDGIADIPGIKFRGARIRPGRREGVESYVQRDLTTLARTGVLCDAVLVSGDEDMSSVVADVQDMGVRVTVVHISVEGNWTISRALRRECDDLIEIGAGHLRPHVELLDGGAASQEEAAKTTDAFSTGRRAAPETPHQVAGASAGERVDPATPSTGGLEAMFAGTGGTPAPQGSAMDQLRAMRRSIAEQRGGDHLAGPAEGRPSGGIDANGFPSGRQMPVAGTGAYPGASHPDAGRPQQPPQHQGPPQHQAPPQQQGPPQHQMQQAPPGHPAPPGQAPAGAQPGYGSTGGQPSMQGIDPNGYGAPGRPPHGRPMTGPQPPYQQGTGPQPSFAAGTGPQPSFAGEAQAGHAPPPRDSPPPPQDPRFGTGENPGYGGAADPNPTYGTSTATEAAHGGGPTPPHGVRPPTGPEHDAGFGPPVHQESGSAPGYPQHGRAAAHTVEDAVHVAHEEGSGFAESIAREAPALWVEAVLARRPRMPSDLEARLLQGSALPVDHLLRDEVREGLRQGFWQALERARP
ncbi:NYN domain-containing protein [Nocardiopsis sp. HNM0947]|uniref:NYN domain-containing protein n=1 Tax=Nocardiopsis coralli TaxID=2772213 RepID=A0ABR9PD38_9ACTN|nr:NYN domain-containing protein [Nocardiopsis coralli]MBE3001756.1 NYN domain-containing protein [Nocardiopsis coralli]